MATTYSRRIYKTTTIGPAVFDGRVRNGNGSDHCGIVTKKLYKEHSAPSSAEPIKDSAIL